MATTIDKQELARRVATSLSTEIATAEPIVDAVFEELYQAFKNGERVMIRHFGTFYLRQESQSTAFRFNPAQRLRALFGWSSTYRGDV